MKMSLFFKKLMVLVVSVFMILGNISTRSIQVNAEESTDGTVRVTDGIEWEKVDSGEFKGMEPKNVAEEDPTEANLTKDGNVRVSIVVDGASTIEAGYSAQGISNNSSAKSYRNQLLNNQKALAQKISKEALNGKTLDVVWNLTLAGNIISANVPYVSIEGIKKVEGVKDVVIENQYEAVDPVASDDPNMAVATGMTGSNLVLSEYSGAGEAVAIIDTGLDTDHRSFDPKAFDYAIEKLDEDVDLIDKNDVAAVLADLNVKQRLSSATADDVYLSTKVPFAFNYVDTDLDVTHDNDTQGEHGSHVAGIAAANRYVEKDGKYVEALNEVKTQGQAPDAQLIVMKVFGKGGGAYDSDYFAAIEDAIVLGAASANLSLGSGNAGFPFDNTYADLLDKMAESDTNVVMSAGNSYSWPSFGSTGYLYAEDANLDTGGSPGSFTNSFTVASVENDGYIGVPIVVNEENIFFDDGAGANNKPMASFTGEHSYIAIDGVGTEEEMKALSTVLEGKIAVISRGSLNFSAKANNAVANGAEAVLIYNNEPGTISMTLTDDSGNPAYYYTAPVASITQYAGELLKSAGTEKEEGGVKYYEGTLTIGSDVVIDEYKADYYKMSDFSSWGTTGDLNLKPEITAPGGNIYSVNGAVAGGQAYEIMSGTSMAAPEIAGLTALAHQYIKENDLVAKTGLTLRQLTASLMMSTAAPIIEEDSGSYYSVLNQGAGLANIADLTNAKSFIQVKGTTVNGEAVSREAYDISYADGKVKAMLGDDPDRTGKYSVTYTVTNFSDEKVAYNLSADIFTQDIFEYDSVLYRDTWTLPLNAAVTFTVDGEPVGAVGAETAGYDFNGDSVVNAYDAVVLLQYVVGTCDAISNEENADIDGDGAIDTYDAYLALDQLADATLEVEAGKTITVTANIDLMGSLDEYGAEEFNGNYVEGYLFVKESASEEGVEGAEHSIPVLGYFGGWDEPESHDKGSYLEYSYETEDRTPYLAVPSGLGDNAYTNETFLVSYAGVKGKYYFGGNPMIPDVEYHPERNAINGKDTLAGLRFTAIRNAGDARILVEDEDGNALVDVTSGPLSGSYYYVNGRTWQSTATTANFNFRANDADIKEGSKLTYSLTMAPEYFVVDGEVDWDSLHENATQSISATVDNTAPELSGEEPFALILDEETKAIIGLEVTVKDNQYIAAVGLFDEDDELIDSYASDESEEAEAGKEYTYEFELDDETPRHLYIAAYDYAANETVYRVNLNGEEELDDDVTVLVSPEKLSVAKNSTAKVYADVRPWGVDTAVTWTSADESIATIDADGIITAVNDGTTTVTAASVLDPSAKASATVTVKSFNIPLNGIIWDENGEVWFSEFNTNSLPNYTKLSDSMRMPIASAAYDENGTLYAATFDSDEWTSSVYTVDESTYELTHVGDSEFGYMDICKAPNIEDTFMAVYGPYVLAVDKTTGQYYTAANLTSVLNGNYLVGIAYDEPQYYTEYDATADWVILLDSAGTLYSFAMIELGGTVRYFSPTVIDQVADGVDTLYFQSLYYDGSNVFWSRYNSADNNVELVMVEDPFETCEVWSLGHFDDGVWPVGGLYQKSAAAGAKTGTGSEKKASAVIAGEASAEVERLTPTKAVAKGSLNTVEESEEETTKPNDGSSISTTTLAITADEDANNGLYTFEYDPEAVEVVKVSGYPQYNEILENEEDGLIKVGFISEEAVAQDDTVAEVTFKLLKTDEETEVTITTKEINNKKPGSSDTFTFGSKGADIKEGTVTRVKGSSRYETSLKLADLLKEKLGVDKFNAVVVANGENFADALSGSYLANKYSAPIIITNPDNNAAVKKYITENVKEGGKVYILGGTGAVAADIETGLDAYDVKRLSGKSRYDTNIAILEEAGVKGEDIIVSTGANYADSLSASAANKPILLVDKTLSASQKEFLEEAGAGKIYIIGGTAAVASDVEKALASYGEAERIAGKSRFDTSKLVAEKFVANPSAVVLVYGYNFPDGLCGGPLAAATGASVMLTSSKPAEEYAAAAEYVKENGINTGYVVGGASMISDNSVVDIFSLESSEDIEVR